MKAWSMLALFSAVCFVAACKSEGEDLPDVDCKTGEVPTYAEIKAGALTKCISCHTSTLSPAARQAAPASINFDTYAAAKAEAKEAAIEVHEGEMPPAGSPKPSSEEEQAIYKWALCGTPE